MTTLEAETPAKAGRLMVSKLLDSGERASRSERVPTDLIIRESCGG